MRQWLRRAALYFARETAFRRRLPEPFRDISLYVSADAALSYLGPSRRFGRRLLTAAEALIAPGMSVWDIGANVGLFTFPAAVRSKTGMVVAVEPDPFLASLLRRSKQLNAIGNVCPICAAVAEVPKFAELLIAGHGRATNRLKELGREPHGGTRDTITVQTTTLDQILGHFGPPDVVKIDTEGAELAILRGATRLLTETRPTLLMEVMHTNVDLVTELLKQRNYGLFDASKLPDRVPVGRAVFDTLAVPG